MRKASLLSLLAIAAIGCGASPSAGPITVDQIVRDPAVTTPYPGSITVPDGGSPGPMAEVGSGEVAPTFTPEPVCAKKCPEGPYPGRAAVAERLLASQATREKILRWYVDRLGKQGWHYTAFYTGLHTSGGNGQDIVELLQDNARITITAFVQTNDIGYVHAETSEQQAAIYKQHLAGLLSSGSQLNVYHVLLERCRQCTVPEPKPPWPAGPPIDLSLACRGAQLPATVTFTGGYTGMATHTCDRNPSPYDRTAPDCTILAQTSKGGRLPLVIEDRDIYWEPGTLLVAGPYTTDALRWLWPTGQRPQISNGVAHYHETLRTLRPGGPAPVVVDVTAPCSSFVV